MARFLVDESLPAGVAQELRGVGHEAVHVFDLGLAGSLDEVIYERAVLERRLILTRDLDFGNVLRFAGSAGTVIVRARRKISISELISGTIALLVEHAHELEELGNGILVLELGRRVRRRTRP